MIRCSMRQVKQRVTILSLIWKHEQIFLLIYKFHRLYLGKWLSDIKFETLDCHFFFIAFLAEDTLISVVTGCMLTGCQKWSTLFWWKKNNERQEVLGVWEQSVLHDLLVLNFSTYSFWVEEIHIYTKDQNEIFFFFLKILTMSPEKWFIHSDISHFCAYSCPSEGFLCLALLLCTSSNPLWLLSYYLVCHYSSLHWLFSSLSRCSTSCL